MGGGIADIILEENIGDLAEQENNRQRLSLPSPEIITGIALLTISLSQEMEILP